MLTPARRRGIEILDDPTIDRAVRHRSQLDVMRSNQLLGGLRAARHALRVAMPASGAVSLLDIGTGLADIPEAARRDAIACGLEITAIGVDAAVALLDAARASLDFAVCADALALPFADRSIDIVICSQVLHHFSDDDAVRLLREMHRVARRTVIVADLRRSWTAAMGFWLLSWPLRFHRVTRHDGVMSVLRGFTAADLTCLVRAASGINPTVERHLGFRLTAVWNR